MYSFINYATKIRPVSPMKGGHTNTIGGQSDNLLKRSSSHFCD
ncbi:hypothetical protein HMPREF2534_03211 [Bacteroides thetaiotaomicron]|nr:hypothetical protein HMPREF2534_03211 [Bacteroides thetaiotaomicron]